MKQHIQLYSKSEITHYKVRFLRIILAPWNKIDPKQNHNLEKMLATISLIFRILKPRLYKSHLLKIPYKKSIAPTATGIRKFKRWLRISKNISATAITTIPAKTNLDFIENITISYKMTSIYPLTVPEKDQKDIINSVFIFIVKKLR